ncbi:MAG: TraB/GumN family protein [Candidatus Woesearchaeota archaeon]
MRKFRNLTLIGTSHISQQSVEEVTRTIEEIKPAVVAIELDKNRFISLTKKQERKLKFSDIKKIGLKGYLFALIGSYIQKKLGKLVNVEPGAEMLAAINAAKKHKLKLALVDQPIEITMKRLSQELTWREKFRFVGDFFRGMIFRKRELKRYGLEEFDLTKVPEERIVQKMIGELRQRYPSLYKVLIEERNQVISKNLVGLIKQDPEQHIVAVIGAGHEADLLKLIKKDFKESQFTKIDERGV